VKMLGYFQKMGVPEARVLAQLGVHGVEDITLDHLATLKGLATAIKEGDTTVDEAFSAEPIAPRRASETRAAPASSVPGPTAGDAAAPSVPNGGEVGTASPVTTTGPVSSGTPSPPPRETRGLRITHTAFVKPKKGAGGEPYYAIDAVDPHNKPCAFRTSDEQLYQEAASFEGTDHLVAIQWRSTKIDPKTVAAVLVTLTIDETTQPIARAKNNDGGDLFK